MFKHLLVATDFSTPAKKMAANLKPFQDYGAERITLVYVRRDRPPQEDSSSYEKYYQTLLDDEAARLVEQGWQVDVRNELGRAGTRIIEVANEVGAGAIVLGNRGRSAVEDVLLGSVATDVLERSPLPVFLCCEGALDSEVSVEGELWDRIIHPTDFSDAADVALEWTAQLAVARPVPVMLMHVVDNRYFGPKETEERKEKLKERHQRLEEAGVGDIDRDLVFGRPKKCLSEAAEHFPRALFVLGSHGHGWLEGLLLGGVARSVARRGTNHLLFVPGGGAGARG